MDGKAAIITGSTSGMGRDPATTALFLATSDSAFIDGQLIRADGGVDI